MNKKSIFSILLAVIIILIGAFFIASMSANPQPAQVLKYASSKKDVISKKEEVEKGTYEEKEDSKIELFSSKEDEDSVKPEPEEDYSRAPAPPAPPLACATPPNSMVSWWTGDIDGSDRENNNNGTLENGAYIINSGKVDSALRFDGVNDFLLIPDDASLTPATSEFTIDFWIKPGANTGERTIIRKFKEYYVGLEGNNIIFEVDHPAFGGNHIITTTDPIDNGQWNFVAVTYNGPSQNMTVYVNGSFANTVNISGATVIPTGLLDSVTDVTIGMSTGYPNNVPMTNTALSADMDEIEFFDRALDQAELYDIYSSDSYGKCKDKVILMGGNNTGNGAQSFNDIWITNDMVNWEQIAPGIVSNTTVWSPRMPRGLGSSNFSYFDDKIWVLGTQSNSGINNEIWWSDNGFDWHQENDASWGNRIPVPIVFNDEMWIFGGVGNGFTYGDIQKSVDGINWTSVPTDDADWNYRGLVNSVVFQDKVWILGGAYNPLSIRMNDVWSSPDGVVWEEELANAPWGKRAEHVSLVFNDKLWVIGGKGEIGSVNEEYSDVWSSPDGVNWTQEVANAPWGPRFFAAGSVFQGKMWLVGGKAQNNGFVEIYDDVWSSPDGVNWTQELDNAPWGERMLHSTVVVPGSFGQ